MQVVVMREFAESLSSHGASLRDPYFDVTQVLSGTLQDPEPCL